MATTWATIVDRCENTLNDSTNAEWSTAEIAEWVNDAVRDISAYFPLMKTQAITTLLNDNTYDLAADFMGILSAEYPTAEDPPEYLSRLVYTHPDFWLGDKWYDILPRDDDSDLGEIWVSVDPPADETITVNYNAHHAIIANPASISGNTTVLPVHQPLIVKYVIWQANLQLLFAEQVAPTSNSSLLMAQLSQNSRRLEASYHTAIRQALYATDGESRPVSWIGFGPYSSDNSLSRVY